MFTSYDLRAGSGETIRSNLCAEHAAREWLSYDSAEWEIRRDPEHARYRGWTLWTRKQCANIPWGRTRFFSLAESEAEAETEILFNVLAAGLAADRGPWIVRHIPDEDAEEG